MQKFKESSTITKVMLGIIVAGILFCFCGFCAWFFLFRGQFLSALTEPTVVITPLPPQPTSTPAPVVFEGWQAEYFDNLELQGEPVLVRDEPTIDLNLESGSPVAEVPAGLG